ncbi:MAG: hypothetical protein R3B72_37965 [Polyangiaceae bacterium]
MVGVVGAELERSSVLTNAPYPDRTLAAWFRLQDRHIHILAAHALTGVDYGRTKGDQFRALLTRLCAEELSHAPRLFALDANEPFVDAWDPAASEFAKRRGKGAALLFGADAPHGLSDALRVWLDARPNVAAELRKARPDGPLVVSHRTRTRDCRYDQCWISDDWHVEDVDYRYGAAVEAGSDHALVVVDLALVAEDLPRDAST